MNMENSDKGIYLLSAALCSFFNLDDNTTSCHKIFSQIFMLLNFQVPRKMGLVIFGCQ